MPPTPRQKSCIACVDAKRRCNRRRPVCQRCADRAIDCVYVRAPDQTGETVWSPTEPDQSSSDAIVVSTSMTTTSVGAPCMGQPRDDTTATGAESEDVAANLGWMDLDETLLPMWETTLTPTLPSTFANEPPSSSASYPVTSPLKGNWFLPANTWTLQVRCQDPNAKCAGISSLMPLVDRVWEMLQEWVRTGHNLFIHRRLYHENTEIPRCMQDALTAVSAYFTRTPEMADTILKIIDDRASRLVEEGGLYKENSGPATGSCPPNRPALCEEIARVQALFIYVFVRLFDGSISARVSAEKHIPTLHMWLRQIWGATQNADFSTYLRACFRELDVSIISNEYESNRVLWDLWALSESIRRTLLIGNGIVILFGLLSTGWAHCDGSVMFSAKKGLWSAASSGEWACVATGGGAGTGEAGMDISIPLLVSAVQPRTLMQQHEAEDFDEFAHIYWTFVVGKDEIESWKKRCRSTGDPRDCSLHIL